MLARFSRSWELIRASGAILRQDKELLLLPLFAGIASLLVAASFLVPLLASGVLERSAGGPLDAATMVLLFLFYLSQYFVMFFFNSALVSAAMIRLDGGDPTMRDGLRIARSRLVQILGYAALAATLGLILRVIEERAGFIGRWISGLLGVAFTITTFLTVPILVSRDVGPMEAVKESAALLKKTWGENIIGGAGMGLVFFVMYVGVIGIGLLFIWPALLSRNSALFGGVTTIVVLVVMALAVIQTALQGVYSAALYRYASGAEVGAEFSEVLLGEAFRPKR